MDFNKGEVYSSTLKHIPVPNFDGDFSDKYKEFYDGIENYLNTLDLKNIKLSNESINLGSNSMFGSSNNVAAFGLSYKKGKLKKLSAFFLVTNIGNVFNFSLYSYLKSNNENNYC